MNKKAETVKKEVIYDAEEDLEIQRIAYLKNQTHRILLVLLIVIFCIMLCTTIIFICNYYNNKLELNNSSEIIEVKSDKNTVLIINNGVINENITTLSFENEKDLVIERINSVELTTKEDAKEDGVITFDVKYNISKNDYKRNEMATNYSDLLIRVSYSTDNKNWTYINNVISIDGSTLNPLIGNYYDIAGIESSLKIATNYELKAKAGESAKMFWRVETIFKYKEDINNSLIGDFKIEYKNHA